MACPYFKGKEADSNDIICNACGRVPKANEEERDEYISKYCKGISFKCPFAIGGD